MALIKDILVARKALEAYLVSWADWGVVKTNGALIFWWSWIRTFLAFSVSVPMIIRGGFKASSRAEPSRKNSGQEAISNLTEVFSELFS